MEPKYKHDCTYCTFLGHHEGHDLYVCIGSIPTVIARFGNSGWEYQSGLNFASPDRIPQLYEAKKRAIERGLLPSNTK